MLVTPLTRSMLVDPRLGGWRYDQVTVIDDPSDCRRLARDLRRVAKDTTGELWLYFVGHGILTATSELILALTDTDTDADDPRRDQAGVHSHPRRPARQPGRCEDRHLDCCYSGRVIDILASNADDLADHTEVRGTYTLTAADRAAHAGQSDGCTAFTSQLLDLIRTRRKWCAGRAHLC